MESNERDGAKYSRTITISLGGSVLSRKEGYNIGYASEFCELVKRHKGEKFLVCAGGGNLNRELLAAVAGKIGNRAHLDELGIAVTRINALILKDLLCALGVDVNETIPTSLDQLKEMHKMHRVTVFGGLMEGITTDSDAVLGAELASSRTMINVGETPYVYDRNPKEKGAKKLERLSYDELLSLARTGDRRAPRTNFIFDYVATLLAARSGIRLLFVGAEIKDLEAALAGRAHGGSTVE
jgi:uridylate kinase